MQQYSNSHMGKEPTVMPLTKHPTLLQSTDILHHASSRLDVLAPLLARSTLAGQARHGGYLPICRGLSTSFKRCGQQSHSSWSQKRGQRIFIIGFSILAHRLNLAAPLLSFPLRTFRFMGAVSLPCDSTQQTRALGHQADDPSLYIHPLLGLLLLVASWSTPHSRWPDTRVQHPMASGSVSASPILWAYSVWVVMKPWRSIDTLILQPYCVGSTHLPLPIDGT
jgi:hypothetical protein